MPLSVEFPNKLYTFYGRKKGAFNPFIKYKKGIRFYEIRLEGGTKLIWENVAHCGKGGIDPSQIRENAFSFQLFVLQGTI